MSRRKSILLIDDDEMVRLALGNALEAEEYSVVIETLMENPLNLSVLSQTLNGLSSQLLNPAGPRVPLTVFQS